MQNLSRRNFLTVAGAAAGSLALAGCSGGEQAADETASTDDTAEEGSSSDGEMTLVTEGSITFGVSPDYPPFENLENGEHVGLDMDLGRAVAEQLGLECVYSDQDFDSIIPGVVAGTIDAGLSGISITPERQEQVDFSDPYYVDNQAVAVMSDNTAITEDNAAETLNSADVKIAVQSGSTGADFAAENYPNAEQVAFPQFTDAFAAVNSGQADAVCGNAAVVNQMLSGAYTEMHTVLTSATGEEYAIAVSKDNPALLEAINGALKTLTDDGTIDQLIADNMG